MTYYCAICKKNPVDAEDGYDTCDICLREIEGNKSHERMVQQDHDDLYEDK